MQMPQPGEPHQKLQALAGEWTGTETMHPTPWDPTGGPAEGHYTMRAALGGFGVIQEYRQTRGGQPSYEGHGVLGYDSQEQCYLWHWSDSMGGVPAKVSQGHWQGNTLTFQHAGPMGHVRYVWQFRDDGGIDFSIENSPDEAQWIPFMNGTYHKKA